MAAPITVRIAGYFTALQGGASAGEAVLFMKTATKGTLVFSGHEWSVTGDVANKKLKAKHSGSVIDLKITNRNALKGTVDGTPLELTRAVLRPIPAAEMAQSDAGPTGTMKTFLDSVPDYAAEVGDTTTFWYPFGPVVYRGRLDGSARFLGIASDPGPVECLPFMRRTLVGDSGQKTQGFLAKLGLTKSYVLVNAFAVALHPSKGSQGRKLLRENATLMTWRHGLYDRLLAGGTLEAIVAFGENAKVAYDLWAAANPAVGAVPFVYVAHPAAVDRSGSGNDKSLKGWAKAITKLRGLVTADPAGDPGGPNFGSYFTETDYARIPRWDLVSQAPQYAGDDSWGRAATPQHNNCCERPTPDDGISIELSPPAGQGAFLQYIYKAGFLWKAKKKSGATVQTDVFGIPT